MERNIIIGFVLAILGVAGGFLAYQLISANNEDYAYKTTIASVPVYSKIPLENLKSWDKIAVQVDKNEKNKAMITCGFEISAVSAADPQGYKVYMENKTKGVYIKERVAYVRGETNEEILASCHVFSCLVAGISCPENFPDITKMFLGENTLNVVLDTKLGYGMAKAYPEIALAYGCIHKAVADKDLDGKISEYEIAANRLFVYPYMKNNDSLCKLQPFRDLVQNTTGSNDSIDCETIASGVFLLYSSNETGIQIQDKRVLVFGNAETIQKAAIIVRDMLSPACIRNLYGV